MIHDKVISETIFGCCGHDNCGIKVEKPWLLDENASKSRPNHLVVAQFQLCVM